MLKKMEVSMAVEMMAMEVSSVEMVAMEVHSVEMVAMEVHSEVRDW